MATKAWAAASNGGWSTPGKWTPATIPASTDAVFIAVTGSAYNVTFNTNASISSLTISSANATLVSTTSSTARALTVSGATTISGGTINQSLASQSITTGSLSVTSGSLIESAGTFTVTGKASFSNSSGSNKFSGGTFNAGTLTVGSGTTLTLSGTGSVSAGAGGIADSGIIIGSGTLTGVLSGSGAVEASGSTLDLASNISASSGVNFEINGGASTLQLDGTVGNGNTFTFLNASAGELHYNNSATGIHESLVGLNVNTLLAVTNCIDFTKNSGIAVSGSNAFSGTSATVNLTDGSVLSLSGVTGATGGKWFVDWQSNGAGGTEFFLSTAVCYAAGTRILTPEGEKAIEDIALGDKVITLADGEHVAQQVIWVGERRLNVATNPRPELVAPVRIRKDAFGDDMPRRDLLVSPDHCMFVDGKLIPAKLLINGMTVTQERDARSVHYFHIELNRHAVMLAEGLPAESYLDTGNRAYFTNSGLALVLHPEFHVNAGLKCWEEDACAPLAVSEEAVRPVWTTLAARAESLGYRKPALVTTEDPDLRLVADGRTIRPVSVKAGRHVFAVPAGASELRLASRVAIPSDGTPWLDDWRRLGVAVKRIVVRSDDSLLDIAADHPVLTEGWYKAEGDAATLWRWTDGNALLPLAIGDGAVTVEVHVGITGQYPLEPVERLAA